LKPQLSNGIIGSMTSGEGFVTKVIGNGKIYLQTRNLSSFTSWVNRYL
ncbi:MAG: TIGR00266 family protein, partial [Crocinitomicaceae bacterium]|nr:TIGR00266 family protein [Crocinitomicaceae bacterium]